MQSLFQKSSGLTHPPIAIAFLEDPPDGVDQWKDGPVPAGCVFWRAAMEGKTFYTVPSDHYNCAVGAHTHGIPQPPDRTHELPETVSFMVGQGYLRMEEVAGIPALQEAPRYIAYGPADKASFEPDVIVIAARPAEAMLIYEAALRSGAAGALMNALGRPACAVLPLTKNSGAASVSLGCKGNRVFTGLPDDEMYVCIPGGKWRGFSESLADIEHANTSMEGAYRQKKDQFLKQIP